MTLKEIRIETARSLESLSMLQWASGELVKAIENLQKAIELYDEEGEDTGLLRCRLEVIKCRKGGVEK